METLASVILFTHSLFDSTFIYRYVKMYTPAIFRLPICQLRSTAQIHVIDKSSIQAMIKESYQNSLSPAVRGRWFEITGEEGAEPAPKSLEQPREFKEAELKAPRLKPTGRFFWVGGGAFYRRNFK